MAYLVRITSRFNDDVVLWLAPDGWDDDQAHAVRFTDRGGADACCPLAERMETHNGEPIWRPEVIQE